MKVISGYDHVWYSKECVCDPSVHYVLFVYVGSYFLI